MSLGGRVSLLRAGTQMRPSLRSDSLIKVSFAWYAPLGGMQVGWICVKHGFAKPAPRRYARQIAVTLAPFAFVDRKKTLLYPPVASTTACAAHDSIAPDTRSRVTMPRARPSTST